MEAQRWKKSCSLNFHFRVSFDTLSRKGGGGEERFFFLSFFLSPFWSDSRHCAELTGSERERKKKRKKKKLFLPKIKIEPEISEAFFVCVEKEKKIREMDGRRQINVILTRREGGRKECLNVPHKSQEKRNQHVHSSTTLLFRVGGGRGGGRSERWFMAGYVSNWDARERGRKREREQQLGKCVATLTPHPRTTGWRRKDLFLNKNFFVVITPHTHVENIK